MSSIIEVKNLSFGYTKQAILKNLSFEVQTGTFLAIAGPNGVGKTTLLNLLCGILKSPTGSVKIDSKDICSYSIKKLSQKIAVVRQEFVPAFDFTVEETVSMARAPYLDMFGFETQSDREIVNETLQLTDTACFADRLLGQLSSGERQRVFIARAIAQNTPLLLLDEPTSFLDLKHQVDIYDLLKFIQREKGKTIIAVTHDLNLANQYCDFVLLLTHEGTCRIGKTQDILTDRQIEEIFKVKTFSGQVGQEKFFLPLGKFAKDQSIIQKNS